MVKDSQGEVGKPSAVEHGNKAGMTMAIETRKGKVSDRKERKGKLWLSIRKDNAMLDKARQGNARQGKTE
jgi:hypothetical protein